MRGFTTLFLVTAASCTGLQHYDPDATKGATGPPGTDDPTGQVDTATGEADTGAAPDTTPPTTPTTPPTPPTSTDPTTTTTSTMTTTPTTTTTTTTAPFQLALTALEPHYGPTTGGTRVVASGSFDAGTEIRFDGVPGAVVSSTATEITVDTPPGASGWVEVQAVSGAQTAPLVDGFQYWTDGAGLGGTFGSVGYFELVGGFWTGNPPDEGEAMLGFSAPGAWELWRDYTTVFGTCEWNTVGQPPPATIETGAPSLRLSSGAASAVIQADPQFYPGVYRDLALTATTEIAPGALYDLDPVAGGPDWPGFGIPGFVEVPPAFDVTSPDFDRPNNPVNVTRSFTLTWTGGGGDYVLIWIMREIPVGFGGWAINGYATCAVPDTGSFTLPSAVWPDWFNGDFLHVQVGRVFESTVTLPHDGSEVRTAGVYWYYGGADTVR